MLEELTIKNYVLVDDANLSFSDGLNIISGETGAGKSILAGSILFLLGARSDVSVVRNGAEECSISGIFNVKNNSEAASWLDEYEIENNDGSLIIRRVLKSNGRNSIYINSVPVSRKNLDEFCSILFDIHGQHEHQTLLDDKKHRIILDSFGKLTDHVNDFTRYFTELSNERKKYEEISQKEAENLRELELLKYAIDEINSADLKPGEDLSLEDELKLISQSEKIFSSINEVQESLSESRGGLLSPLRSAVGALKTVSEIDKSLNDISERLESAFFELQDIEESVRQYKSGIEFNPERIDIIEERLVLIQKLKKKYGQDIEAVLKYKEESEKKIFDIENWENNKSELKKSLLEREQKLIVMAKDLSEKRKAVALKLENEIVSKLGKLGMPNAVFKINLNKKENASGKASCGPYGFENIEFTMTANKGEPLKALKKIASGGEISRIMLAIKSVIAETDNIQTLIFDEIDTGIGGEIAVSVGDHLRKLSDKKQVICITHLASIAAYADHHIKVIKQEDEKRTYTNFKILTEDSREKEIARMLSGESGDTSLLHARELLSRYKR